MQHTTIQKKKYRERSMVGCVLRCKIPLQEKLLTRDALQVFKSNQVGANVLLAVNRLGEQEVQIV